MTQILDIARPYDYLTRPLTYADKNHSQKCIDLRSSQQHTTKALLQKLECLSAHGTVFQDL